MAKTAKEKVTIVVSGVRRGAALVETTLILLSTNSNGDQEGTENVELNDDNILMVALTLYGDPGAAFTSTITFANHGSVEKKGRFTTSVALRAYPIPYGYFK